MFLEFCIQEIQPSKKVVGSIYLVSRTTKHEARLPPTIAANLGNALCTQTARNFKINLVFPAAFTLATPVDALIGCEPFPEELSGSGPRPDLIWRQNHDQY